MWCVEHRALSPLFHSRYDYRRKQEVDMASIIASLPPSLLANERKSLFRALPKLPVYSVGERQNRVSFVAVKATGESSESSSSLSIVKSVQSAWDKSEDRLAFVGLGFAAVVALWASTNLITAIDRLPVIPGLLELVGILFSWWFIYRYLLFKPDREELIQIINKAISEILGGQ
ncbi:protein CURVATURE THYLAKOID 1C, chloroplastic isoform X2 [Ziziphus jujuba]|uniref:Protein CURVATURE THYLAKOID 1C, chloroplastic isoform X2 n=1 Tax=Ziziphus jujuba TaxID=326968 RepID=A0A6P3YZS4_ZIZJJ|nr:protein CURVATURE THYLAKOID 1C, chloroplastic isoform X2 [Ziziphus jujuba]